MPKTSSIRLDVLVEHQLETDTDRHGLSNIMAIASTALA